MRIGRCYRFCLDAQSGIVSDCENAKEYRKLIGLQI